MARASRRTHDRGPRSGPASRREPSLGPALGDAGPVSFTAPFDGSAVLYLATRPV